MLNTALQHGNPIVHKMYFQIITAASRPFLLQIDLWIYEGMTHYYPFIRYYDSYLGKLLDPQNEFFITADLRVPVENLWFKRYRIENRMIPSFVRPTEAQKVLLIGKSINFLREVCHQPLSDFRMPETQPEIINPTSDLHTIIAQRIDGN